MRRRLFRDLGHSSINQYAVQELGFSKSRTDDFIRLSRQLENLPAVRGTRKDLVREVKKAKRAARVDPAQGDLLPSSPPVVAPRELPVRFQVDLTPEQEARRAALVERLHKLGGVPNDRAELMLEALAALLETKGLQGQKYPRGHLAGRPPVQIHVHDSEGKMTVQTSAGERKLSLAEAERMRCDAAVCEHGGRNTTTIPPRVRREVMARDQHRCQATGCGMSGEAEFNCRARHKIPTAARSNRRPPLPFRPVPQPPPSHRFRALPAPVDGFRQSC